MAKTESTRIPTPPTTRKQDEDYERDREEQEGGDAVDRARDSIREAQAALRNAEDALDEI